MVSKVSFQPRIIGCICLCMLTASTALADDPPESATSKFLGAVADRGNVSFVLQQASPLFGGREYYVSGEGRIVIVDIRRQPDGEFIERRFEMADASEETDKLIAMIRQVDLLSIPLEQKDQPRRTCSTPPLFIIRNGAGDVKALPQIKAAPTKEYESVCMAIAALMKLTRGKEAVYQGDYDTTFNPNGFEWTQPILAPGKKIRWAPHATPGEIEQAEQAYRAKVEIQLKQVQENQTREAKRRETPTSEPKPVDDQPDDNPQPDKKP